MHCHRQIAERERPDAQQETELDYEPNLQCVGRGTAINRSIGTRRRKLVLYLFKKKLGRRWRITAATIFRARFTDTPQSAPQRLVVALGIQSAQAQDEILDVAPGGFGFTLEQKRRVGLSFPRLPARKKTFGLIDPAALF